MRQGLAAAFDRRARGFEFGRFSRIRPCAPALAPGTKEGASERAVAVRVLRLAERVVARVRVVERERGRRALLRTAVVCVELFKLQDGAPPFFSDDGRRARRPDGEHQATFLRASKLFGQAFHLRRDYYFRAAR